MSSTSKHFVIVFLLLSTPWLSATAEEVPLPDLSAQGTGTNSLGVFSVEMFADRHKFPTLDEKAERPLPVDGKFEAAVGRASVRINPTGAINFETSGFNHDAHEECRWLPMLVFTPKVKGTYKIGGLIKFWCDNNTEENSVSFNVVNITGQTPDNVIFEAKSQHNGDLDLASFSELQEVDVTDSIGLTIWRNKSYHASGGEITELSIESVK